LIFVVQHLFNKTEHPNDYLLLQVFRSFLEIDMYASMTVHTEETIAKGRQEVEKFAGLLKVCPRFLKLVV
jgi:hypothetical protein